MLVEARLRKVASAVDTIIAEAVYSVFQVFASLGECVGLESRVHHALQHNIVESRVVVARAVAAVLTVVVARIPPQLTV